MATLLKKFRITFSGIVEVEGMNAKPSQHSIDTFMNSRMKDEFKDEPLDKKSLRQIRFGELLKEHSSQAKLVVLTMPIGRKTVVSNLLYMGWLDVISNGLDTPILLVRGNQTNVLTFYSWRISVLLLLLAVLFHVSPFDDLLDLESGNEVKSDVVSFLCTCYTQSERES